ncbi:hypothetical protein SAMD00023353_0800200 [Rosellinia necatrix]|uniref:C2H2-type domain-containing protein n=1 Tax=Rosellinia necatrix TaxID=77044 RepID=A0A1S8A5Y1_ROSNE|nr:hypothetical protein SAMD00023353_0800200 [Rosellinia necatrix]
MSYPILNQWISCLRTFDDLSPSCHELIFQEVGSKHFREEFLIWGTQEVLPDLFAGKFSSDCIVLREAIMENSLSAILHAFRKLNTSDQEDGLTNRATEQKPPQQPTQQTTEIVNLRNWKSISPVKNLSKGLQSHAAFGPPPNATTPEGIKQALGRLSKLAAFGTNYILPNEAECPGLSQEPGAKSGFPRAWKLISEKFPNIDDSVRMSLGVLLSVSISTSVRNEKGFPFEPEATSRRDSEEVTRLATDNTKPNMQYICVFPGCPRQYQLFQDEKSFLAHLNDMHCHDMIKVQPLSRSAAWCTICDAPIRSDPNTLLQVDGDLAKEFSTHLHDHVTQILQEATEGVRSLQKSGVPSRQSLEGEKGDSQANKEKGDGSPASGRKHPRINQPQNRWFGTVFQG